MKREQNIMDTMLGNIESLEDLRYNATREDAIAEIDAEIA
jgi:hypothetical protein